LIYDGVQRVPHLVGHGHVDEGQQFGLGLHLVVEDALRNVYDLNHHLHAVFCRVLLAFDLDKAPSIESFIIIINMKMR